MQRVKGVEMTCIVGLEKDGAVYIGGDSAGVSGYDVTIHSEPKVFRNGPMLIGYTSSFRMGQLLEHVLQIPDNDGLDDMRYLVSVFIPALRECLKSNGFAEIDKNAESGGTFLLGYNGKLYKVASDYQVSRSADGFDACGCGESYALGAMMDAQRRLPPRMAVEYALEISYYFSVGVRPPFCVVEM